jgi:hypothetical protein
MKGMADSLRDLGEPIVDRTLVLNLLCGLNPRYDHLKTLIKRIEPFPTFHIVHNKLLLEELTMETEAPTPASALYSAPPSGQAPSWARPLALRRLGMPPAFHPSTGDATRIPPAAPRPASNTDRGRRSHKGSRRSSGYTRGSPSGRGGGQAWPSFYNP